MEVRIAVQCTAACGTVGTFLFTEKDEQGRRVPISPVFDSLAELYPWMRANGWESVPGGIWTARRVK